ncbi:MAG: tetratricopeptide repeat protein [Candidatus Eisenbacteria sp.]|nr:tetratricopeptide repeat protein [Candidatus Eisenbacteria bacterium]
MWIWPELLRPVRIWDDLIPTQERESYLRARNLIRAGQILQGEELLRALGEHAFRRDVQTTAWVDLGASLLGRGQVEEAAAAFARAITIWDGAPEAWRIHFWRGVALVESELHGAAARELVVAADGAPRGDRIRASLLRWAGWLHVGMGDLDAARENWQRAISEARGCPGLRDSLRLDLAEASFSAGDWDGVLRQLERPRSAGLRCARREFLVGRAHLETGGLDSAQAVLGRLVAKWGAAPSAWLDESRGVLGWLALKQGKPSQALDYYRAISGERPGDLPATKYGSAVALMTEAQFAEAEQLLAPAPPVPSEDGLFLPWIYALAYARFNLDKYMQAIESLESFRGHIGTDTLGQAAWSLRGDCFYRLRKPEEAYASYQKAASILPTVPDVLLRRQALAAMAAGHWGTAARLFGDLIVKYPGTPHAAECYFWRAEAFYRLGRTESARRDYLRAERRGASKVQCAYALAWCAYNEARYEEALQQFDRALEFCRGCPFIDDLLLRRGNCLFNIGRIEDAAAAFADAVEMADERESAGLLAEASFRHAWTLLRLGDFAAAETTFAALREREGNTPRGAEALYWEAQALFRNETYRQAIERFRLLQDHPAASDSLRARGLLALGDGYFNLRAYGDAIEWYRLVLEAPGADRVLRRTAHESLFECRGARGEWDQAGLILSELKDRFPESRGLGEKYLQLAEGYLHSSRYQSALASYGDFLEKADPADPRLMRVRFQMAHCREELGERREAAGAYEALGANEAFRQRGEALLRAGILYMELGDARNAIRPLEMRLSLNLDPARVALTRAYLAEAYQQLDEKEAARNEWEKVVHAASGAPDSLRAIGNLQLGRMAFGARDWEAAFRAFAAADTLGLTLAIYRVRYWAGESAYRMGDTLQAMGWMQEFLEQGESEPLWEATARIRLAECYEGMGRPRDALRQYERVVALALQEEALMEEARRRILLLSGPGGAAEAPPESVGVVEPEEQ